MKGNLAIKTTRKSAREIVYQSELETVVLDGRLALYGSSGQWLALSDLHYGYEVSRRASGALWPMWGREAIDSRIDDLLNEYQPRDLILNGDVIDSSAAGSRGAFEWLESLTRKCENLILVRGNHDRGKIVEQFDFLPRYQVGELVFHHGHLPFESPGGSTIEVMGHLHPSVSFRDGAGLSIKLPSLVQEKERWIMPAFSPWAGGGRHQNKDVVTQWACSPRRIFPLSAQD